MELIKIENRDGKETVNARELFEFLESRQRFSDWIKSRIAKYGFIEDVDYVKVSENYDTLGGTQMAINYYISIDMAKELSMVENNEKGRQARLYFIECENKLKDINNNSISRIENMFISFMQQQTETNKLLLSLIQNNQTVNQTPVYVKPEFYSLKAYMILKKIPVPHKGQMILLGKELRKLSEQNKKDIQKVPDEQYGEVNGYHIEVLEEFFKQD